MKVLIVVDVQNDFTIRDPRAKRIAIDIGEKMYSGLFNTEILFTQDTHHENYLSTFEGQKSPFKHCIKNTPGWELNDYVKYKASNVNVFNKETFASVDLVDWCNNYNNTRAIGIESIELVGLYTDTSVISHALILRSYFPNIPIIVDASYCMGTSPEMHKSALKVMKNCLIDILNE